ncbi:MAG: hypothetical protein A3F84_23955 [Candidatus Handelsmanbacteria bacterium RIFCSPLOWO2_12_FULL_64_10]|uniref:Uncharacterized protein n=1 Tax=Handelsmanbacteria sp. (strain RIFCSPLOWO2_12_FULL_64_10) TaxID=1817868 RepID=A0A1F6CJN3_HANXR|nr:MAG: hypothetical protein A3F84_23955 [Candidatus Handelsmanbacteria bacterium RIFCSPLOWO2_12_FULL_64_10]
MKAPLRDIHPAIFVCFLIALAVGPCAFHVGSNSLRLRRMEGVFRAVPHPPGTELIRLRSDIGILHGNSNHCDFFVGELRRYGGSESAIREHYSDPRVLATLSKDLSLELVFIQNGKIPDDEDMPDALRNLSEWDLPPGETRAYLVFVFDQHEPNLDPRCH